MPIAMIANTGRDMIVIMGTALGIPTAVATDIPGTGAVIVLGGKKIGATESG